MKARLPTGARGSVPGPGDKQSPGSVKTPPRTPSKWWRVALVLLPTFLILGVTEGVLRLAGAGYPTTFFVARDAATVETNERFAWRFMSRALARDPLAFRMAKHEPANTARIFILGESAAQGFPDAAFGFGRILDVLLRARHPERNFEVINTAMTAVNSHAVREIARECLRYEPDLFLVYCGNNEVVGPFGPGTVFQSGMPPLWLIRLQLRLSRSRAGQELSRLAARLLPGKDAVKQWSGMEIFLERRVAGDDPRLERVYRHFSANMQDIIRAADRRAVPMVICTVPVNLAACAPFASEHRRGLTESEELRWRELYSRGTNAEAQAEWAAAAEHYAAAAAVDPLFAEVDFRRARCLAALGKSDDSRQAFSDARDHDALRFRADSRMNALLRDLAQGSGPRVRLYDAEADLAGRDEELFHEHVHPTFSGNYRLARGVLPHVEAALPRGAESAARRKPALTEEECAARLAYTPWSRWKSDKIIMSIMQRPPFALQYDRQTTFPGRRARFRAQGIAAVSPAERKRSLAAYELALKAQPAGIGLRENLVELLDQSGQHERALHEAQALLSQGPATARAKLRIGDVLLNAGRYGEALPIFRAVLRTRPELPEVHSSLVGTLIGLARDDEALAAYRAAIARGCDTPALRSNVAGVLLRRGDLDGAEEHLRHALQWTDEPIWHVNLGAVLYNRRKYEAALAEFKEAVSAMPNDAALRYNLGRAWFAVGNTNEAIAEFQHALRISPDYEKARAALGRKTENGQ